MTRAQTSATSAARPPRTSRRRRWLWVVAGVLVVLVGVTLIWFQPQKLFYDQRVDEGLPSAAERSGASGSGPDGAAAQPVELASGDFLSREHETHGTARVLMLPDARVLVRFEGFAT